MTVERPGVIGAVGYLEPIPERIPAGSTVARDSKPWLVGIRSEEEGPFGRDF